MTERTEADGRGALQGFSCRAPGGALHIGSDGAVGPCPFNGTVRYGNIRTDSPGDLWSAPVAERLRASTAVGVPGPGCAPCALRRRSAEGEPSPAVDYERLELRTGWLAPLRVDIDLDEETDAHGWAERVVGAIRSWAPGLVEVHLRGRRALTSEAGRTILEAITSVETPPTVWADTTIHAPPRWLLRLLDQLVVVPVIEVVAMDAAAGTGLDPGGELAALREHLPALSSSARRAGHRPTLKFSLRRENWAELGAVCLLADELHAHLQVELARDSDRSSLSGFPSPVLEEVIGSLQRQDMRLSVRLANSRAAWRQALDHVVRLADRPSEPHRLDLADAFPPLAPEGAPLDFDSACALLGASPGQVEALWCDDRDVVHDATDTFVGLGRDRCVGRAVVEVFADIDAALGRPHADQVERLVGNGRIEWRVRWDTQLPVVVIGVTIPRYGAQGRVGTATVAITEGVHDRAPGLEDARERG